MISAFWQIWLEMAPWLLFGAAAAAVLHVALPGDFVTRHLSGRLGVLKSVIVGIPLPLCSCAVIPAGLGLKKNGASDGAAVGFLISTPQTGVDSILVSGSMLGWPFAILKVVAALVMGLIGGLLTPARPKAGLSDSTTDSAEASGLLSVLPEAADTLPASPHTTNRESPWPIRLRDHFVMLLQSLWIWLVIGVLVSAALSHFVPADSLADIPGMTGFWSLPAVLLIATPLYVCATASVPIAAALVASGLSPGAALVFLMAGPATNVATIGAVYQTLGRRALAVYLTTIVVGSIVAGLLFNAVLPTDIPHLHNHQHSDSIWRIACGLALGALMMWFAGRDVFNAIGRRRLAASNSARHFSVSGMTCDGCAAKLQAALLADPDITDAQVAYSTASASVEGTASEQKIRTIVDQTGFHISGKRTQQVNP